MALFRNLEKPKGLRRKPIYWDPEKEEREEREQRIREQMGVANGEKANLAGYCPNIKGQFRSANLGNSEELKKLKKKSIQRMLFFVILLALLLYMMKVAYPLLELFLEKYAS